MSGRRPGTAGFSLVELLIAMAIFTVIGFALIALLRQSTAFLERGQAGSEVHDLLEIADRKFADDFTNVYIRPSSPEGLPDVRMMCDALPWDQDGDREVDVWTPRLSFVRSVQGEVVDRVTRHAGVKPGASGRIDGDDDLREAEEGDHRAPGGKQEVTWVLLPAKKDEDPAVMTLYRGFRMPLGGRDGFLPRIPPDDRPPRKEEEERAGVRTREQVVERLRPVLSGVLHLEYGFWTRFSTETALVTATGAAAPVVPPGRPGGGLTPTWDSTRGILPSGIQPGQFFLATGPESLEDSVDDVFPRRVRVTLVVERVGQDAATGELARSIGPEDTRIPVTSTRFAPGIDPLGRFVKIGREWIRWNSRDDKEFVVEERGARGTRRQAHDAGAVVHAGVTMVREYDIPTFRENWND